MSHSTKKSFLKRTLSVLAIAAAGVGSIIYIQEFAKIDPLVNMRKRNLISPDQLGMTLGKVHLVQYRGDKRVTEASVDKVFIPSNRSQYRLEGVSQGTYTAEDETRVHFAAPTALWNASGRILTADNARVWNKDIDLKTPQISIDERTQALRAPGTIRGKFYKGQIEAKGLLYAMNDQVATLGPMHWAGHIALDLQEEQGQSLKRWEFETEGNANLNIKNGVRSWDKGTATDGDIIVKADHFEHNEKTDVVTATGNVRYFSAKANLTCAKAVIYRKDKRAVLTGAVDMLVKPKAKQAKAVVEEIPPFRPMVPEDIAKERPAAPPVQKSEQEKKLDQDLQSPKSIRDYPVAITAAKIEYWYGRGSRRATITGEPQARQELPGGRWRHISANQAFYDGEKDTLKMVSRAGQADTRLRTSIGDDILAQQVIVSTKEDDEDLEANGVKGKIYGASDDDGPGPKGPDPIRPGNGGLQGPIGGGRRGSR